MSTIGPSGPMVSECSSLCTRIPASVVVWGVVCGMSFFFVMLRLSCVSSEDNSTAPRMFPRQPEIAGPGDKVPGCRFRTKLSGAQRAVPRSHRPTPPPAAIASRHRQPPSGQPEPARAAPPPGVGKDSPEGRARAVPQGKWVLGGADSARPGTRRMASPPDRRRPRTHVEVGLLTCPSSGPSTRVAPAAAWTGRGRCFGRVFRHGP